MASKGLPSKYAKMGFKEGWKAYKASKSKRKRSSNPRPKTKARKVRKTVARRKSRRRSRSITIPLAPIAGLAAGLALPIQAAMDGNVEGALYQLCRNYTGVEPRTGEFKPELLAQGLIPLVIGGLVHKYVGGRPININGMLARANVPFIRI